MQGDRPQPIRRATSLQARFERGALRLRTRRVGRLVQMADHDHVDAAFLDQAARDRVIGYSRNDGRACDSGRSRCEKREAVAEQRLRQEQTA